MLTAKLKQWPYNQERVVHIEAMKLTCHLCHHACQLGEGETGFCKARGNRGGRLTSLSYGLLTSVALDPIEKKPLYHFHPGSRILSVGSFGCNLACPFCQNYSISQAGEGEFCFEEQEAGLRAYHLPPEELVALALDTGKKHGNIGVAFTYNEPLMNYEYLRESAALLKEAGLKTVLVSNGELSPEPFRKLLPLLDAANIDLKGFTPEFYQWVGGDFEEVKANIRAAHEAGCHVEITTLVIPGRNDGEAEMAQEAQWLAGLSPEIPLHLSRYFPRYKLNVPSTPIKTLERLREIAGEFLRYVYLGNV